MEKVKILCVLNALNKCNGIATYVMNYYKYFDHNKVKMDFLVVSDDICEEYKSLVDFYSDNIYICSEFSIKNFFRAKKELNNILSNNRYDIVYCHILYTGYFYFMYAKKFKIEHRILHSHNTPIKNKNVVKELLYRIMSKLAVKSATDYFACSKDAGEYLFKGKEYLVIKNAINLDIYKYNENKRNQVRKLLNINNEFLICQVGRFREQKNHKFSVDFFEQLLNVNNNCKLIFVGDGPLENEIKEYVTYKNLKEKVIFLGVRNDVNEILQAMDVFILPSLFEGLGIVAIEAQASSLPCIVSDVVPREVQISDKIEFVSLNNIEEWINKTLKYENNKRNEIVFNNKRIEYEINNESKKLEEILFKIKGE